ncbi:MAG: OsmC family protein [Nitrospirota bacterium]|jgi:uncharacterized OsmC-like protein
MAGPEDLKEIVQKRMELMKRKPEAALYRPRVTSRHVRGLYTESRARRHVMKSDYPPPAGGEDLGPNPIEMLLGAFAACIEASFYEFAAHRGYRVDAVSVEVEGTLDLRGLFMIGDVPASFKDIRYTFSIESPEDGDRIRELANEVLCHCPVVASLSTPVPVTGEVNVKKTGG